MPVRAGRISSRRRRIQASGRGGARPRGRQVAKPATVRRFQNSGRPLRLCLWARFPPLKDAPVIESRVCQYENTTDDHFLVDRHPASENIWLVGGGSGHGFKHGPALGEMVAELVMQDKDSDALFRLARAGK